MALLQSVLAADSWDPAISPIVKGNCTIGGCIVDWGSTTKSVPSTVLTANGIIFAINAVIFLTLGSAADYGTFGRCLLLFFTVLMVSLIPL
jgi:hypothetical protein